MKTIVITEAQKKLIIENEGTNLKKARNFLRDKGYGEDQRQQILNSIRTDMPNSRLQQCKFMLGVVRLYLEGQLSNGRAITNLNKILKYIASDAHVNEYDYNLNGESLDDLVNRFSGVAQNDLQQSMDASNARQLTVNNNYTIVPIDNPEEAAKYGDYTSWCVTHDEYMYNSYTHEGVGRFYFCLRKGFENEPKVEGDGCPLDSYGLSMIAVSVNEDGSVNTITCRWNHDNGGNDNVMTIEQLEDIIGRNFYQTFKPYTIEELHAKGIILFDEVQELLNNGNPPSEIFNGIHKLNVKYLNVVELRGKYNIIKDNQLLCNQWFDDIDYFNDGLAQVELNGKWNFINKEGELVSNQWFDDTYGFYNGLAIVGLNGKWNFINKEGEFVLNQWFDGIGDFRDGFAEVELNGKWNFINKEGEILCNQWFGGVGNFRDGFAKVYLNGEWNFINIEGKLLSSQWFGGVDYFNEGFAKVELNNKYNLINIEGKLLSSQWFDYCNSFDKGGLAIVCLNDKYNFINTEGEILCNQWFDNCYAFNGGFAVVKLNNKYNLINIEGKLLSSQWFDDCYAFNGGFAVVKLNNKYNFINTEGELISNQWFDDCYDFNEGFLKVKLNNKYNFINREGQIISSQWFDYCDDFHEGFAKVYLNGKWYKLYPDGTLTESKKSRKTIIITESQKKKLKKAIAAQDQVDGKVNAGVMDAVAYGGGMCENIENETKWNGEGYEFKLEKAKHVPTVLYHASLRKNRESILANGILAGVGEEYRDWWNYEGPNGEIPDDEELPDVVFLSYKPNTWSDTYPIDFMDIYEIDTKKLNKNLFYLDPDRHFAIKGCFCYLGDIPTSAFRLIDCVRNGKSFSINENVEDGILGPYFETWYRGYDSKYPNLGVPDNQGMWITDEIEYAKLYADGFGKDGKIAKVVIDIRKVKYMGEGDMLDMDIDPYYSDETTCEIVKKQGYNSWLCYYWDYDAQGLCLIDSTPIVSIEDVDIENLEENVEDDTYTLCAEKGMSPYYHVNESNEEIITLYHGVNRKGLEFNLEHGGFIPRVCSEGGPKAVWLSEKQYNYEFTFAFDMPKSVVEQLSNVDYVYGNKIGFDEFNCRLVKSNLYGRIDSRTVVEVNLLDERLSKIQFRYFPDLGMLLWKEYKEFPLILEKYINPYIEKYQTLGENLIKESPDIVYSMGLDWKDEDAIPFMFFRRNENFYVGDKGEAHIDMMEEIGISKEDRKAIMTIGNAFEQYVDMERTGRYWPNYNVISFWEKPKKDKMISTINNLSMYANVDVKYLLVDYWGNHMDMLIPYRWFINGTFDMLKIMGLLNAEPYDFDEYCKTKAYTKFDVMMQNGNRYKIDINGDFIENKYSYANVDENVESEIVNPEDVDLSSFNIKKKLNPKFWKDGILDSRIRLKLLDIADDFISFLGVDWAKPEDITMTGSLANFNWDENYSDIDLHIIMDYSDVDERKDFVSNYFYSQKKLWNEEHSDIKIMGFPVEVFVQDVNERHDSSGVYSLEKNRWVIEPEREKLASSKVNKSFIKDKVSDYMNKIDKLEYLFNKAKDDEYKVRRVMEKSEDLFNKIKDERKLGFEKSGGREINNFNICFKALRRNGYIEKLVNIKSTAYDKLKSLQ